MRSRVLAAGCEVAMCYLRGTDYAVMIAAEAAMVMAAAALVLVVGYESLTSRPREVIYVEHGKLFGKTTTRTTTVCLLLLDTGKVSSSRGVNLTHHDPLLYIIPQDALLLSHLSSPGPWNRFFHVLPRTVQHPTCPPAASDDIFLRSRSWPLQPLLSSPFLKNPIPGNTRLYLTIYTDRGSIQRHASWYQTLPFRGIVSVWRFHRRTTLAQTYCGRRRLKFQRHATRQSCQTQGIQSLPKLPRSQSALQRR
jgi:hypothetical protein